MRKQEQTAKVTNVNRAGQVFDPAVYKVTRAQNPELYEFLEDRNGRSKDDNRRAG